MGLYQTKKICTAKETINKTKRQPTEWEKILQMIYEIRGWFPKYINNSQFNSKKTKQPNEKMGRTWTDISARETNRWPKCTWKGAQHG